MKTYLSKLDELRADAVAAIENQAYYLASGDLSLWGQLPRLEIGLANGQRATVRALGCTDLDVLAQGEGWQPGEPTPLTLRYADLPAEALLACADYARQMKDVYHDDPDSPECYRPDPEFEKSDKLAR